MYNILACKLKDNLDTILIDRGANRGMAGGKVVFIETPDCVADVKRLEDHQVKDLKIRICAGVIDTNQGEVVALMQQYALIIKGCTIHSSIQIESFGNNVKNKSLKLHSGKPQVKTVDWYLIPLSIKPELPYMTMQKTTPEDMNALPHVILTSNKE